MCRRVDDFTSWTNVRMLPCALFNSLSPHRSLPALDFENLNYVEKDTGRFYCTDKDAITEMTACFDTSVIDTKITEKIWMSMIRAFIDYEFRKFKKK